jgi:RND family efflux transporter MFP subunit
MSQPIKLKKLLSVSGITMSILLPLGVIPRVMQAQELDHKEKIQEEAKPQVSISKAILSPTNTHLSLPGNIEAVVETPIYARSNGYVQRRLVDIGDLVSANQLMAEIETPEIDQSAREAKADVLTNQALKAQNQAQQAKANADVEQMKAQLSQMKASLLEAQANELFAFTTYNRYKKLGDEGAVSFLEVDERETRYKTATATRMAAEERIRATASQITAAQANVTAQIANVKVSDANIESARAREGRTTSEKSFQKVLSPFAGVVTERNIEEGALVTSGSDSSRQPLYRIARIDVVKVFVDVPQYAISGIKVGVPVKVDVKEFPSRTFEGKVARTSVALDPATRTLRTEIHISNKDRALAPGMYADAQFEIARGERPILIPTSAVLAGADGPHVILVDQKNRIRHQNVSLGDDLGKDIEIVKGLKQGEIIVVNPQDSLKNGTLVATSELK